MNFDMRSLSRAGLPAILLLALGCGESEVPGGDDGSPTTSGVGSTSDGEGSDAADGDSDDTAADTTTGAAETGATTGAEDCAAGAITISELPDDAPPGFDAVFDRDASVWGLHIYATPSVGEAKLVHAVGVLGQYLDNDENCEVDDPAVLATLQGNRASIVMFATEAELEANIGQLEGVFDQGYGLQDLYDAETHPDGAAQGDFDASLEEVLHLVTHYGWSETYPDVFGERDSAMAEAMDVARGGHFESVPASYPREAWYHYDDQTCDYECMATEYFYWALTSWLGGQDFGSRCNEIAIEWEACTPEQFETIDVAMHGLMTDRAYALPTVLPDGHYEPTAP
ncbi:MAG: hypothetical protein AAF799_02325 [Myxococcota bacterium]